MNWKGSGEVALSIVAYSICSGTMLLFNKMTLAHLPFSSLVTSFQLLMAVCFIFGAKSLGYLSVDPIKREFVIPYTYYIVGFALGVYCNMKSLSIANVETVIVAKALTPCLVAILDAMFLGREFPSTRSWGAIGLIAVGAYGYASYDEKFQTQGISAYFWPFCCKYAIAFRSLFDRMIFEIFKENPLNRMFLSFPDCLTIAFEMAYGKSLLKSVKMKTQSGPVLYTNLLGLAPMLIFAAAGGEFVKLNNLRHEQTLLTGSAVILLLLSSIAGTGIGYSSWW